MLESITCNLCQFPGNFETATDIASISSNLRRFQDQKFTVWRCENCHSLHSKEAVDLNKYYEYYIKLPMNYFTHIAYGNRLKLLKQHGFSKQGSILDFGCGQGLFLSFLKKHGYKNVAGYDPYHVEFSNPETLNKKYDFVVAYDVIEHVENPKNCFYQLIKTLTQRGVLVIGTPDAEGIENSENSLTSLHQPYHRHILSKKVLLDLGRQYDLNVELILNRSFYDTFYPGVNWRALSYYIERTGGFLDTVSEPPKISTILVSPGLLFYALAGYFLPGSDCMTVVFRLL